MKNEKETIDSLLERNTAEQLAKVDWEGLNAAISTRLDKAGRSKTSVIRFATLSKIAGGLVAAAVVVLVAMLVRTDKTPDLQLTDRGRAVVEFVAGRGSASVTIEYARAESQVLVDLSPSRRKLARCDVEIIDVGPGRQENTSRGTWIIISRPGPVYADNGVNKDMMDIISLF